MEKSHTSAIELAVLRLFTTASCNNAAGTPPWDFLWRGIHTANSHHLQIQKHIIKTGWWFGTFFDIFYFSIYWEVHHPNWRTPSFFRGVGQPPARKGGYEISTTKMVSPIISPWQLILSRIRLDLDYLDFGCGLPLILPYFFLKLKKPWEMMINPWPSELGADSWVRQFPRSWWPPVMFLEKAMTRVRRGRYFFSSVPWSSWSNFHGDSNRGI